MIFDEYESYVIKYQKEYGSRTIVLLECGSFYEIYSDGSGLIDMRDIGDMLNIQVSRRNKQIPEVNRTNYEMAGFPSHTLQKFVGIFLQHHYTVVVVSQVTPPPNPKRAVTEVISPGTTLQPSSMWDSSELMVIYVEEHTDMKTGGGILSVGCSGIDVTTGSSYVLEVSSKPRDLTYPLDEVYRMMTVHRPREVYIMSDKLVHITPAKIHDHLELDRCYLHDHLEDMHHLLKKLSIQNETLKQVWPHTGLLSPIEFLNLEKKPTALISFVKLVQFALHHNESLMKDIQPPVHHEESNTLILSYNCAHQLDIVHSGERQAGTMLNILNNCRTSIGKRYMRMRLLSPWTDPCQMQTYHTLVEECLKHESFIKVRDSLHHVYDVERLFRRIDLNLIHPLEVVHLHTSLGAFQSAAKVFPEELDDVLAIAHGINSKIESFFDMDRLCMYNRDDMDATIFRKGVFDDVDDMRCLYDEKLRHIHDTVKLLNDGHEFFKLEQNDKDGYYLTITPKRWKEVSAKPRVAVEDQFGSWANFHVRTLTSTAKVTHPLLDRASNELVGIERRLYAIAAARFKRCIEELHDMCHDAAFAIISHIQRMDYVTTNAHNALVFKLCKPHVSGAENKSYADMKGLRHLIISYAQPNLENVANDVLIGSEDCDGMLLYGINSAGKSSLMKAIGVAVIMAQAGMYVPCASMALAPYDKLFTRIFSQDDIQRGHSTFTKEIIELRNILKRATPHSLVIGDELCSGTENVSALAIVSAGIHTLASRHVSFVFATHLHDLVDIPEVKELTNVRVFHLAVMYDQALKKLVYDRTLKPGNGSTMYGIEVCKSLDIDPEFLTLANAIRQRYTDVKVAPFKQSGYNGNVIVHMCGVCKTRPATEVHHIQPQHMADKDGYIGTFHKNKEHNLTALCEGCHNKVHHGDLQVVGYVQSMDGVELKTTSAQEAKHTHNHDDIFEVFQQCKDFKYKKDIYAYIQKHHPSLSLYKIKQGLKSLSSGTTSTEAH